MTELPEEDKTMFILCKCGKQVQVSKDCEIEWQICQECSRMGCYEILPF